MWIIVWLILAILVGLYASGKGRSGIGFFLISIVLSPLIGFIIVLLISDPKKVEQSAIATGESKKCPYCAEIIKSEAIFCRFCSRELPKIEKSHAEMPTGKYRKCKYCGDEFNTAVNDTCRSCSKADYIESIWG